MHHSDTLETPRLDFQGGEGFLQSFDELLAVERLTSSLEVTDVSEKVPMTPMIANYDIVMLKGHSDANSIWLLAQTRVCRAS